MVSKVKDGLFLGDIESSQDPEFIQLNKISRIIKCASNTIPNFWAHHGIRYLSIDWDEDGAGLLFDSSGTLLKQVKSFIDQAHAFGECVLIHCYDGGSRYVMCASCMQGLLLAGSQLLIFIYRKTDPWH